MKRSLEIEGYWVVSGKTFSPKAAEVFTGVTFTQKIEPGEICQRGRLRGSPSPEGWGSHNFIVEDDTSDFLDPESAVFTTFERCLPLYRSCGAEEFQLHFIVFYETQCNLQFSAAVLTYLARLAQLGVAVTMTCDMHEPS